MKNLRCCVTVIALAIPAMMSAIPANPRPRTLQNPDGTTVTVRVHGDEYFHFMTDADCTTIMEKNEKGYCVPMQKDGGRVAFTRENVEMLRAEQDAKKPAFLQAPANSISRMAGLDNEGRSKYPTIGNETHSLVVLVEFADVDFTVENPQEYFTRQLNEPGFSDYGGQGSALDYYKVTSNNLYTPQFDVYGPVKISKEASYFKDNSDGHMALLIQEAITQLHESGELNLADYDFDEDGTLDTVFIYYAGYGQADSDTETIWPHQYDYQYFVTYYGAPQLKLDGIKVGPYACGNELNGWNPETGKQPWRDGSAPWVGGIGTFVHEYGHVLGLPDLYDVQYSGGVVTPGEWDVMDSGCYNFEGCVPPLYSAYEQWVCHWLEYTLAEDKTHYDLQALGNAETPTAVRIRIPMSESGSTYQPEYFVIESRDNSGWDACFPNPGLMVWRINYKKSTWTSNAVNSKNGSNVEIVYANGSSKPLFESGAIYPGAKVELVPSKSYTYWNSPIITDISYDSDQKTSSFDYNMVEPVDVSTVLHDNPLAAADGSRSFTLEWDAVEGVESYLVTVRTANTKRVVAKCDDVDAGDATSMVVSGLSSTYWKLELEAYVKCVVNGMISSTTSNIITFKPSELQKEGEDSGVEWKGEENIQISGGKGIINAPSGATVVNLAGQRVGHDNLPAGVYIVTYGSQTVKVMVR